MASQCREGETTKHDQNPSIISYLGEPKKENPCIPQAPFDILNKYGGQLKRFREAKSINHISETTVKAFPCQELSTDFDSIYPPKFHSGFLSKNTKDEELTSSLLDAAKMFSNQQFDRAQGLLSKCILLSSPADNPVQRVVKLFAKALWERVDIERGKIDLERTEFNIDKNLLKHQSAILAAGQKLPSPQVTQFTAIQAILDSVGTAKKIHLVDFGINNGMHGSIMIQGLANRRNCSLELLKMSAVGTSKYRLQETGKRLSSFAESMNLPFLFKPVVSEMEISKDSFKLEADEVVAVYLTLHLWTLLAWPNHLRAFIQSIKKLNPRVMVANEIEASTSTSTFIERFHGAFSFVSAVFDCHHTCLERDIECRNIIEEVFYWNMIRNIITAEDEERCQRHAKIGFWRELFAEFNIVESELSDSSLYQASLLIKKNARWNSCTLEMDGKSMIVGWKGTPLQSVSAWKILDQKNQHDLDQPQS